MKIGIVRRGFSASGGAEAYLRRFADAAAAAGHEPLLFCGQQWGGVWKHRFISIKGASSPMSFANELRIANPKQHCDVLFSLERVWECDVYRAGDGVHASWLKCRKQFESFWKPWLRCFQRKHRQILALEQALFTGGARSIIANSMMVKAEIERLFATPAERVQVIYNGLPEAMGREVNPPTEVCHKYGLNPKEPIVLFVGSGWERKGLSLAIDAVSRLPNSVTLLVAGRGKPTVRMVARGKSDASRVKYLGARSAEDLAELFSVSSLFVLPTYYEPFSNACLEAFAAGVPVITTSSNGFAEILTPGKDGEIVAPGDLPALTSAMHQWLMRGERPELKAQLQAKARKFSIEHNVAQTLEVLNTVAKRA